MPTQREVEAAAVMLPTLPGEPAEGAVTAGKPGIVVGEIFRYKSNSEAATPFNVRLKLEPDGGETPPLPVMVSFFVNNVQVTAAALNCTVKLVTAPESLSEEILLEFTTHAVAGLKKGEVLTIFVAS